MAVMTGFAPAPQVFWKSSKLMSHTIPPPNPFDKMYFDLTMVMAGSSYPTHVFGLVGETA
jgi:hypothetical protein